ncbi:Jag family protein [Parenemella sanctibonifatiensis]|nr:R3H domain-containing nucleic acid-binding protein [Parenemella sanctibonifatiensis]
MSTDEQATPDAEQQDTGAVATAEPEAAESTDSGENAGATESDAPKVSAKQAALDEECDIATDYLEELMEIAGLDGEFDLFVEGGRPNVSVETESTQLVGKDGEVLDALQELCRLAVMTETGVRSRLMLDVAGHRDQRRRELRALANDAIQDVKESGEPARLSPMNPFERKIVHDAVAEAGLASESEGEEPQRRVVVLPA